MTQSKELVEIDVDIDWLESRDSEPLIVPVWRSPDVISLVVVELLGEEQLRAVVVPTKELMVELTQNAFDTLYKQLWFAVPRSALVKEFDI